MQTKFWVTPLALSLLVGGCGDLLTETPKSFLTTGSFYQTAGDLDNATQAIYQSLRTYSSGGGGAWWAPELAADIGKGDPGEPNLATNGSAFLLYDASAGNSTQTAWNPLWQMIERANLVLDNAPNVDMSATQKAGLVAEAKFLRGYAYLQLMKRYSAGNKPTDAGVPLMLTFADAQKKEITRASSAEVFAQIIKDLSEAEPALTVRTDGRAPKGAAQMALADTYLWRSSYMLTGEWQQASDWAKKVIDSGSFALNNGFFSTFLASNKAPANREMIFRVVGLAQTGATTQFSNTYYPRVLGFGAGTDRGGFGAVNPTAWFVSSYKKGDIRGTVGPERGTTAADYAADTVAFRTAGCVPAGCRTFPPHVWKFRVVDRTLNDVDVPLYRYAETFLFYAEAQNELGNTAEAIRNVNIVRARARKGLGTDTRVEPADLPSAMTKLQARDAIFMERVWELAFEGGQRWFDMIRRDSEEPGYWKSSLEAHDPDSFARGPITDFKKRFPLPQSEINVMPTLTQNPGY